MHIEGSVQDEPVRLGESCLETVQGYISGLRETVES